MRRLIMPILAAMVLFNPFLAQALPVDAAFVETLNHEVYPPTSRGLTTSQTMIWELAHYLNRNAAASSETCDVHNVRLYSYFYAEEAPEKKPMYGYIYGDQIYEVSFNLKTPVGEHRIRLNTQGRQSSFSPGPFFWVNERTYEITMDQQWVEVTLDADSLSLKKIVVRSLANDGLILSCQNSRLTN